MNLEERQIRLEADKETARLRRQAFTEYQSRVQDAMRWYEMELKHIDDVRDLRLERFDCMPS